MKSQKERDDKNLARTRKRQWKMQRTKKLQILSLMKSQKQREDKKKSRKRKIRRKMQRTKKL